MAGPRVPPSHNLMSADGDLAAYQRLQCRYPYRFCLHHGYNGDAVGEFIGDFLNLRDFCSCASTQQG